MIVESDLTLEESQRVKPLLDLYDSWSSVIWAFARRHTGSENDTRRAVVDAFGVAARTRPFFDGSVSPIARLLMIIEDRAPREFNPEEAGCRRRCPLASPNDAPRRWSGDDETRLYELTHAERPRLQVRHRLYSSWIDAVRKRPKLCPGKPETNDLIT